MATGIFEIEGRDYWTDPLKFSARVLRRFIPEGRYGLFLDAPPQVDLRRDARIPLLALYAVKRKEARIYDPWTAGHLVCVRLEDRQLEVEALFPPPEQPGVFEEEEEAQPEPAGEGAMAIVEQTDASRLEGLSRPGHCVLMALMLDRMSNRVQVHVSRSPTGYQDDEVTRFLAALEQQRPPPEPVRLAPGQDAGTFTARPESPRPPDPAGIAVRCERVLLYEQGRPAWVRGAFRVPVLPHERVPPTPEKGDDGHGEPRPVAIVPVWLVVVGSRTGAPVVIPLRVPCFQDTPAAPGESVIGYFEYDVFQHPAIAGQAQTNFVYAFCGEVMTGPARLAVVTRTMLDLEGRRRP
jgi:hypothetical protein